MELPFCGHGGHSAPYVRSGVIADDAVKTIKTIVSSNSVNKIVMNAHTVAIPFCGHGLRPLRGTFLAAYYIKFFFVFCFVPFLKKKDLRSRLRHDRGVSSALPIPKTLPE